MTSAELLTALKAELRKGRIYEAPLRSNYEHVDGMYDDANGRVYVNPAPQVAETLLHEVLHRRFPRWGEKRVTRTAKQLMRQMTARQAQWWYAQFKRLKKTIREPIRAD